MLIGLPGYAEPTAICEGGSRAKSRTPTYTPSSIVSTCGSTSIKSLDRLAHLVECSLSQLYRRVPARSKTQTPHREAPASLNGAHGIA
ncbi:MAG: hypothetical protein N3G79_01875 [Sulfolobales archaeon]|nr:hypothetical protein [Sulfolobales archaeon]